MKPDARVVLVRQLLLGVLLSLAGTLAHGMDASGCANLRAVSHPGTSLAQAGVIEAGKFVPEEGYFWEEPGGYASKEGLDRLPSICRLKGEFDVEGFAFEIWIPLDAWSGRANVRHGCCLKTDLERLSQGVALVWTKTVDPESARMGRQTSHKRDLLDLLQNIRSSLALSE